MLASQHHLNDDGEELQFEGVQVMLHSDHHFGPKSVRELSVRSPPPLTPSTPLPPISLPPPSSFDTGQNSQQRRLNLP